MPHILSNNITEIKFLLSFVILFQYCFEIYSADNASGLIKACKTDSEGKVVEGIIDVDILFTLDGQ